MVRPWRLAFVILVVAEIFSLYWLGKTFGFVGLLAYLIVTAILGVRLIRASGASFGRLVSLAQTGAAVPDVSESAAASLLKAVAGLLVLLPGLASDVVALLLLLPATRQKVARLFPFNMSFSSTTWSRPSDPAAQATIIEGEAVEIVEPDKRLK